MAADPNGFFQELRRRKVFRVAAVYAVVAWGLVEVTDTTFPRLALPDWAPTLVLVLVLAGFPVALVLAWALEVTPEGVKRAPVTDPGTREERPAGESSGARRGEVSVGRSRRAWTGSRIAVVGAVAVLAIAGGAFVATWNTNSLESDRVAVVPFEDHSGREDLEGFGRMAAEWVTEGLVRAEVGRVVHTQTTQAILDEMHGSHGDAVMEAEPARAMARGTGARYVVTGAYYVRGQDLQVQAQVVDGRSGRVVNAMEAAAGSPDDPMAVLQSVRERVLGLVAARLDMDRWFGDAAATSLIGISPPSYESYRHYSECMQLFGRSRFTAAVRECELAVGDSSFLDPFLVLVSTYANLGDRSKADSIFDILSRRRTELSAGQRIHLDWLEAWLHGDWAAAALAARELADLYGWQAYGYMVGWSLYRANRPAEAVEAFERVDPEAAQMRTWAPYYRFYAHVLHMLGEHERELAVARRGRGQHPDRISPLVVETTALAALRRTDEAEAVLGELLTFPGVSDLGGQLHSLGVVFLAYGQPEAADRTFRRGIRWYETRGDTTRAQARWYRAVLTLRLGDIEEARRRFEGVRSADLDDTNAITYLGVAAALQGDTITAREMEAELAAIERPYDRGTLPYLRANILAVLGDREAAVSMLRRAFSEGRSHEWYDAIDPEFTSLRGYPPFEELIRPKG